MEELHRTVEFFLRPIRERKAAAYAIIASETRLCFVKNAGEKTTTMRPFARNAAMRFRRISKQELHSL
jgi:hypothetical protein